MEMRITTGDQFRGSLGAIYSEDESCRFLVWAPRAKMVEVHFFTPRERVIAMQAAEGGYFRVTVSDVPAGSLYKYRLNGQTEYPDPASRFQPQGVHGPSAVCDARFDWQDHHWAGLPLDEYVIYELHAGTFTPEGTLDAIIPRIADLRELGITAIELMPVAQFPGTRNWGYDGAYPFAVHNSYGGPEALKRLVNACHRNDICVVLDVVYNHLGPEGNYLQEFAPYVSDAYKTPWGGAMNFDQAYSDEVRRYFIENALQWIGDFHVDALRLDATHAIVDASATPFLEELGAACHAKGQALGRNVYLIPESNRNDAREVTRRDCGGCGLDAAWNDDFHHALHVLLTGERNGYYEDYSGVDALAAAFQHGYVYQGQYSRFRKRRHGNSSRQLPGSSFVVFAQNHDQVGNRMLGDRLSGKASFEQLKLAAGAVLLSPYIPLLFMGEEYGETSPFPYFISHGDAQLIDAVRRGRQAEFGEIAWSGEIPDPQEENTFFQARLNWEHRNDGKHASLRHFYEEMLRLRRAIPALRQLDNKTLEARALPEQSVLLVSRSYDSSRAFAAFHFGEGTTRIRIPHQNGYWRKLLDSEDPRWGGKMSAVPEAIDMRVAPELVLGGWSLVLFTGGE